MLMAAADGVGATSVSLSDAESKSMSTTYRLLWAGVKSGAAASPVGTADAAPGDDSAASAAPPVDRLAPGCCTGSPDAPPGDAVGVPGMTGGDCDRTTFEIAVGVAGASGATEGVGSGPVNGCGGRCTVTFLVGDEGTMGATDVCGGDSVNDCGRSPVPSSRVFFFFFVTVVTTAAETGTSGPEDCPQESGSNMAPLGRFATSTSAAPPVFIA
jgi:hypothetical protein